MNRLILATLFLLLACPLMAQTGIVTLAWDANPAADQVHEVHRLSCASRYRPLDQGAGCYRDNCCSDLIIRRNYFFRVTASNVWGESGPSNVPASRLPPAHRLI